MTQSYDAGALKPHVLWAQASPDSLSSWVMTSKLLHFDLSHAEFFEGYLNSAAQVFGGGGEFVRWLWGDGGGGKGGQFMTWSGM